MKWLIAILCAAAALAGSPCATGQEDTKTEKRFQQLESRLTRTEAENAKLREELSRLKGGDQVSDANLEAAIDEAMEKRDEGNVVTWDKLTKSGNPIQIYGFIRLDAHYNSARANNDFVLFWALPEDGNAAKKDDDSTVFQARWSRVGLNINAGEIVDANVKGRIEIDFANYQDGTAESRAAPRVRLAYIDMDWGDFSARFGQDWDIVGPLHPSVHLSGLLWNVGNLGDRRPMAAARFHHGLNEDVAVDFATALVLVGAVDNQDLDKGLGASKRYSSTDRDGFDSGWPGLQARAGVDAGAIKVGVWGLVAALETDARFPTSSPNGDNKFTSYCAGTDINLSITDQLSLRGEAFIGQALSDVRGGIGQSINTVDGDEIRTYGGWVELGFKASDLLHFVVGGAIDNPYDRDLTTDANTSYRTRNLTYFAGCSQHWGGGFKTGVEAMYWSTKWVDEGLGTMVRVNAYTQLNF